MKTEMKVTVLSNTAEFEQNIVRGAKLCYSSADIEALRDKVTPEESERFLNMIMGLGHCYDEETEVLTQRGFVKWSDIAEYDLIGSVNPETMEFAGFEKPSRVTKRYTEEGMLKLNGRFIDLQITDGHKLYCSLSATQEQRSNPHFELVEANKEIPYTSKNGSKKIYERPMRMSKIAINPNKNVDDSDIWYSLYGFFIGDGYCLDSGNQLKFHLKKERKVKYLYDICKKLGLDVQQRANDKYVVIKTDIEHHFRKMFYNSEKNKTFPNSFLTMSKSQYNYFVDGLRNSDGSKSTGKSWCYHTTSVDLLNKLQSLCSINAQSTSIVVNENKINAVFTLTFLSTNDYPMVNDSRKKDAHFEKVEYKGYVYCATVSTGLLVIRRNNKVVLCGNCSPLEHSTVTFGIEGVSRALTHQLVRHRIASYSQKSQRYVKEAQFEYVVPKDIENNDFAKNLYIEHMRQTQLTYDMIVQELLVDYINDYINENKDHPFLEEPIAEILNVKDFIARFKEVDKRMYSNLEKKAIENARYVLPNACETKIQMTINVRALFNFFKERLCDRAQEEIRELAWLMWIECMKISPTIFRHAVPSCVNGKCKEGKMSCMKMAHYKQKHGAVIESFLELDAERKACTP